MTSYPGRVRPYAPVLLEVARLTDATVFGASLWLTVWFLNGEMTSFLALVAIASMGVFGLISAALSCYRSYRSVPLHYELGVLCMAWTLSMVPGALATVFYAPAAALSDVFAAWFLLGITYVVASRLMARAFLALVRMQGMNFRRVAILGATQIGADLAAEVSASPWMGLRLIGFFDDRMSNTTDRVAAIEVDGTTDKLIELARSGEVDLIYIALPLRAELRIGDLTSALADTTVTIQFVPDLTSLGPLHARFGLVGTIPTISIVETPFRGRAALAKRMFDLAIASVGLFFLIPVMLMIGAAIKWTSPGPVFFRQPRYGLDGQTFQIWKFRTMSVMQTGSDVAQAVRGDPRVTRLGAILRRYSMDELPQLFNVLDGSMSIIGPRPHPITMNEQQRLLIDRYMQRHIVKPGITGWAQVNGYRGETDTKEKVQKRIEFDLDYIEGWSLWLDLKILWRTARSIWNDPNAY